MTTSKPSPWGTQSHWLTATQFQHHPLHTAALQDWLLDPSSLTARLKSSCSQFAVKVLFEGYAEAEAGELAQLHCEGPYWVREVLLLCDQVPWVFARSMVPQASLEGGAAEVTALSDKPLGELLFTHPSIERNELQVLHLDADCAINRHLQAEQDLWGRRSRFLIQGDPLLVSEIFLPPAPLYQESIHV